MTKLHRILTAIGAGVLLFLTLGAWSLSSPVGSSPDDDFHLASIWCGQGERDGLCEAGSSPERLKVPEKVISGVCFAARPDTTASCQGDEYLDEGFMLAETSRVNAGNQYPPGFYFATSLLTNDNMAISTIAIRLANSALFSALAVFTWCLLPHRLRFSLAASAALTLVPVGLFFIASTNPSSWALTSGALVLPAMLGFFTERGWRRGVLGGIAAFAGLLAFGSRGDAAAYTIVALLAATVLSFAPTRRFWLSAILPAALIVTAVAATLSAGQIGLAVSGEMGRETEANPTSKLALAALNLVSLPRLWAGVFGHGWGLGWLDTGLPDIVPAVGVMLTAGVLFVAFRRMDWRRALALFGIGLANLVVPTYILVQSGTMVGSEVQPRYILPLVTMFIAAALAPSGNQTPGAFPGISLSRLQLSLIAFGLAGTNAISLFVNLKRNVSTGSYNLDGATDWWWVTGPSPFGVLAIGAVCGAALMTLIALSSERSMGIAKERFSAPASA